MTIIFCLRLISFVIFLITASGSTTMPPTPSHAVPLASAPALEGLKAAGVK